MVNGAEENVLAAEPQFEKLRHVKYWTRCLKTLLPSQYTSLDSNRMYLGYFILAALDLLGALQQACSAEERQGYIDWIYGCQHAGGGFKMWQGTDFGEFSNGANVKWDPANVPATYFALVALLILDDDLSRVKRRETLNWLRLMQRDDGSFGETLVDGQIEGGKDPRFGYCAAGARSILRGSTAGSLTIDGKIVEDIDVDALVQCICRAQAYDGGLADQPFHEPHSGYTFCSLGALAFTGRLQSKQHTTSSMLLGPDSPEDVIRWLVHRQTDVLYPDATLDTEFLGTRNAANLTANQLKDICSSLPSPNPTEANIPSPQLPASNLSCAGMNGRTNKIADTCYAWWSGASLHILGQSQLYDAHALRRYLLEKTQHPVLGGFGKFPGDMPDLYHSYLGLAAFSLTGEESVKEVDPGMCVSKDARARLRSIWKTWGIDQEG